MIKEDAALRGPDRVHVVVDFASELDSGGPSDD